MTADRKLCVLLLAAGSASRFGSAKQCWKLEGVSLVCRAAQAGMAVGAQVVVVTGAHAEQVASELTGLSLALVHNPNWAQGMGTSIACGIRHIASRDEPSDATMIHLADQPLVGAPALRRLIDAYLATPDRIAASDHGGALGPPCIFPGRYYAELSDLSGTAGARRILDRYADQLTIVAMPEAALDIDTPADCEKLRSLSA